MSLPELQALPKKSLLLLASARNLKTTGNKAQLAQRVFEHDHGNPPRRPATNTEPANAPTQATNIIDEANIKQPFSNGQLDQLRLLIAEAVGDEYPRPTGGNTTPFLSPVTSHADHPQDRPGTTSGTHFGNLVGNQQDGFRLSTESLGTRPPQVNHFPLWHGKL